MLRTHELEHDRLRYRCASTATTTSMPSQAAYQNGPDRPCIASPSPAMPGPPSARLGSGGDRVLNGIDLLPAVPADGEHPGREGGRVGLGHRLRPLPSREALIETTLTRLLDQGEAVLTFGEAMYVPSAGLAISGGTAGPPAAARGPAGDRVVCLLLIDGGPGGRVRDHPGALGRRRPGWGSAQDRAGRGPTARPNSSSGCWTRWSTRSWWSPEPASSPTSSHPRFVRVPVRGGGRESNPPEQGRCSHRF
jgi:hypothetical protein